MYVRITLYLMSLGFERNIFLWCHHEVLKETCFFGVRIANLLAYTLFCPLFIATGISAYAENDLDLVGSCTPANVLTNV